MKKNSKMNTPKYRLKKDIIIPAGTVFGPAPTITTRSHGHIEHIFGLTLDTSGSVTYCIDNDPYLSEWFEEIN